MSGKEDEAQAFINKLVEGKFSEVIDQDKLDEFYRFISKSGKPAGGFLLAFSLENNSLAWFCYQLDKPTRWHRARRQIPILLPPEIFIPTEDEKINRQKPEEYQEYPVWWLE